MQYKSPILASGSPFRRAILVAAGVVVEIVVPQIDESFHKADLERASPRPSPGSIALKLAELKALDVLERHPGRCVIGSDQVLAFDGEIFSKPQSIAAARQQLRRLRGRSHELLTAVVVAEDGKTLWTHMSRARLTMRDFSDAFLEDYLERQGDRVTATVGAYEIEGLGSQLFGSIEGDHFTIVGLPLLPLMDELRNRRFLKT